MPSVSVAELVRSVTASRTVRAGFAVTAVLLGVLAVVGQWEDVRASLDRLSPATLGAAFVAAVCGLLGGMVVWRTLLAGLGSRLRLPVAARILFVSQLGKYLPGSVWPVLAQMELGHDRGVPRRRSATAFALLSVVVIASGGLAAAVALPFVSDIAGPWRWAAVPLALMLVLLHPRLLNPLLDRVLRAARRPPLERPLTLRVLVLALAWGGVTWVAFGAHVWLLAVDLGADPWETVPLAVGGYAAAWLAGYLFVVAPAGAGVREVTLVAVLAPVLPRADALVVALVSRLLMVVADLVVALLALSSMPIRRGRTRQRLEETALPDHGSDPGAAPDA